MSSSSSERDNRAKNAISSPDVVPESPLTSTQHVWYPAPNQPHYTILLGQQQHHQQQHESSPYRVIARVDNGQQDTIRFGPSHHHQQQQPSATITPLLMLHEEDDDDDEQLLKFLQQSPPNANHIFRPRSSRRASSHGRRQKRQESSSSSSSLSIHLKENTRIRNINNNCQREDMTRDITSSPWEPIPWQTILAAGPTMDESERAIDTRRHQAIDTKAEGDDVINRSSPLLAPRFGNRISSSASSSFNKNNDIMLPCPPSPLVRSSKKRPATNTPNEEDGALTGWLVTPESATALRLEAAMTSDDSMSRVKKRAKHQTTTTTSLTPPAAWPSLLQHFWTYCEGQRPHLLETLMNSVRECQEAKTQRTDDNDDDDDDDDNGSTLSSRVMTVLVREWGGPLLGEVYRQVLAQQQEANDTIGEIQKALRQPPAMTQPKPFADDTEMAIAYGMYLAKQQQQQQESVAGDAASSRNDLQQAVRTFHSMTTKARQDMWQSVVDTQINVPGT